MALFTCPYCGAASNEIESSHDYHRQCVSYLKERISNLESHAHDLSACLQEIRHIVGQSYHSGEMREDIRAIIERVASSSDQTP